MDLNRKMRRSNLNCCFFFDIAAICSGGNICAMRDEKFRNVSVNPQCIKRRKADRGH